MLVDGQLSKKIMKYVPKSKIEAIKDAWIDDDGMWIVVKTNWNADRMDSCCHTIHEDTIKDLRYQIAGIRKLTPEEYEKSYHHQALEEYNDMMERIGMKEMTTGEDGWFEDLTIKEMVDQTEFQLMQVTDIKHQNRLASFIEYYQYK